MKNLRMLFALMLTLTIAGIGIAAQPKLDVRGGVSYDFTAISKQRFHSASDKAENLINNADFAGDSPGAENDPFRWRDYYSNIHHPERHKVPNARERMREVIRWEIADGVASIIKPVQLRDICGPLITRASAAWCKLVELPHTDGGTYKLTFKYQARHNVIGSGGNNWVLVSCRGEHKNPAKAKEIKALKQTRFEDFWGEEWGLFSQELVVPAETKYLNIVFRIDGVGELKLKEPALVPVQKSAKLTLRLTPHGFLDSVFALSQNQPAIMNFAWGRNCSAEEAKLQKPRMRLCLPNQVKLEDIAFGKIVNRQEKGRMQEFDIEIDSTYSRRLATTEGLDTMMMSLLLSTAEEPGTLESTGSCIIEENGQTVSNLETFAFKIIPTINVKAKAQRYLPGFYADRRDFNFSREGRERLAKFFGQVGTRWIICAFPQDTLAALREHGVKAITPELYYIANGFRVGFPNRPDSDKFKYLGNATRRELEMATCPVAIYERRPFFQETVRKYLADNLQGTDGLWANWEPYMFNGKGCFCDSCREKFAEYVNVPLEQMKQEWPQELMRGKKYYAQAVRFRSLEHAKLVRTIHEAVCEVTGGDKSMGFIPGISWTEMCSIWREIPNGKEVHQSDYAADLRWINPWGPYVYWQTHRPYVYYKDGNLRTFVGARDVRAQVNLDYSPEKRPKLLAFPHGSQGGGLWVTQPEALEMDLNSFFFNGYDGSTVYLFPRGYDNRYWSAFARAAENAADYEDFVFDGERIDQRILLEPSAPYALPVNVVSRMPDLGLGPSSILQHVAYEKDGKIIVAVFNFWEKGNAFFTMKVNGLPGGNYQLATEDVLFAPKSGINYFSAAELAQGVQLFIGAVRCQVFELTPGAARPESVGYNAENINELKKQFLPELTAASLEDQEYMKKYDVKKSVLTEIANAGITCRPHENNESLLFSSGNNQVLLNCKTMNVVDWQCDGKAQLLGNRDTALGAAAFWKPSLRLWGPYLVTGQEKIDGGLLVSAELQINDHISPELAGLLIRQYIEILDSCRKISIKTELINFSTDELPCSYQVGLRYHCFPKALADKGGILQLSTQEGTLNFTRNFGRTLFSVGDEFYESVIRKIFSVTDPTRKINSATAVFKSANINNLYRLSPESDFVGFALWDGGSQLTSSFEPCFKLTDLPKAGDSINYKLEVTAE